MLKRIKRKLPRSYHVELSDGEDAYCVKSIDGENEDSELIGDDCWIFIESLSLHIIKDHDINALCLRVYPLGKEDGYSLLRQVVPFNAVNMTRKQQEEVEMRDAVNCLCEE